MPVGWVLGYLLCHGLAMVLFPSHARTLSFAFLAATPLLAALACLRRCRGHAAVGGWAALALAMLLWAGGMAAAMYHEVFLGGVNTTPGLSMLLYVLYGVPLTFVLASPGREVIHARIVDGVLAAVLGYLFFVHTFSFATLDDATSDGLAHLRRMFDVENVFVAAFALVRYRACERASLQPFFRALAVFSVVYLVTAGYFNHSQAEDDYGALVDVVVDVPFALLAWMAWRRRDAATVRPSSRRLALVVRAGSPLIMPLSLLVVSALIARHHLSLAVSGFVVAVVGYGLRSVLTQVWTFERQDTLRQLARIDGLTGLANRRQFDEILQREWNRARRSGGELALLMIDIDHFKQLNDAFGHPEGDRCLRAVAQVLAASATRATEWVARYGGEEFVVVLAQDTAVAPRERAEALRVAVERLGLAAAEPGAVVTVSVGVAMCRPAGDDPAALLRAADAALYEAKRAGRNRVAIGASAALSPADARPA